MVYKFSSYFAVNIPHVHSIYQPDREKKSQTILTVIQITNTVNFHLSELIGTANHPDMQKIRIIGFFFENRLHWQFEVRLLLFAVCTVPASKLFDDACFQVLETITLYVLDPITDNFEASQFCSILDKFTRIIIGDPDKGSSTVYFVGKSQCLNITAHSILQGVKEQVPN
jgi:hypothetical protein